MLLNSIIIENIRSYTHEEIIFPRGISLFEGDIGSGKSTILMSIEFALFGLGSQKAESLLAKKSESGYVILEFSVDGAKYEIKRTLKRKSDSVNQDPKNSWIKTGDVTEPLSPSELKQRVLQILKFNEPAEPTAVSRIFRYAIFTPQEAMKEVLDSKNRLVTIRRAFGIEDYSIAETNAREITSEIRLFMAVLQQKFSNISDLECQINESERMIISVNSDITKLQQQKKEFEGIESIKSVELKEFQTKNNEKIKLESKKENIEEKIDSLKSQIKKIEQEFSESETELIQNTEKLSKLLEIKKPDTTKSLPEIVLEIKKYQSINNELIKLKSEKDSIQNDISKIKETLGEKINSDTESLENISRDLEIEKNSLKRFYEELNGNLEKVNSQKIQKQTIINSLEKEIAEFSQLGNACPTCKQEITENHHHDLVDTKRKEIEKISLELKGITDSFFESKSKSNEIQSKIDSYDAEILQIQKILPGIQEYTSKSSKLVQIEAKIKEINIEDLREFEGKNPVEYFSELKDKVMQHESVMDKIKQIIDAKQRVERLIQKNQIQAEQMELEITDKESELKQIITNLESFENLDGIISKKESELNNIRRESTQASSALAASEVKLGNEQEKIVQNKKNIEESKKWQKKFNLVSQYKEWLESFFVPAIIQIEKQVLLSILQNFNETYRRWYSILVEDQSKESRIDENFTPIVSQDGYEQEIGYLSGGEKTSIALAYRLTLNSLMRKETDSMKSNLLILDEPTDGFSKNQLGKIREVLDELKSEQIILVSHEKELETYVDNIFQISKQDGISKIVRMN
ncbi:MAG: SMC family ATPase [Thermoproteota archaeon]